MGKQKVTRLVEATSVILFLIQAMRVIFSVMFGIIYDQVFAGSPDAWLGISNLLLLLAFLAPLLARGNEGNSWLTACAVIVALARVALTINDPIIRLWSALIVIAAGSLYLALLYKKGLPFVLPGLAIALALDQFLRLTGQTYDLSLRPEWLPVQAVWTALLLAVSLWLARQPLEGDKPGLHFSTGVGIGGLLFLEISLLSLPNGVARWTAGRYAPIAMTLLAITLTWAVLSLTSQVIDRWLKTALVRTLLGTLLVVCLVLAYFTSGWLATLMLLVAQGIVLLEITHLLTDRSPTANSSGSWLHRWTHTSHLRSRQASGIPTRGRRAHRVRPRALPERRHACPEQWRGKAAWLAMGMIFYLLLNYFNAFAFTYPYAFTCDARHGLVGLPGRRAGGRGLLDHPAC